MENLFLPFELALLAKEKGFNELTLATYNLQTGAIESIGLCENDNIRAIEILAPLYQQITDWFRDEHKYDLNPVVDSLTKNEKRYFASIMQTKMKDFARQLCNDDTKYTYHEALNKAIEKAFELI